MLENNSDRYILVLSTSIPALSACSKNRLFIPLNRKLIKSRQARRAEQLWKYMLSCAVNKDDLQKVNKNGKTKLFVNFIRKNYKSDPVNILPLLCDCLKQVLGIDDRYYEVFLTWECNRKSTNIIKIDVYAEKMEGQ